ncbi:MAG: PAS domain S-box protein, partial [Moraxellaceae bacterium]
KAGKLSAIISLHQEQPFKWTDESIGLVKDTAERTWAVLEKVRAQAALKAERDQSQYIFDNMTEGFAIINFDWQMLHINSEGLRIGQRTPDDMAGKSLWDVWPEIVGTEIETRYRQVMTTRVPDVIEQSVAFSNGNTFWLEIRIQPILSGGIAVIYRNISDRKNSEQALLISERNAVQAAEQADNERRLLDALLDAVPVGIGMADNSGKLIRYNRANKELWGGHLPESKSVDEYHQWKAWWADGSERHGRRLEPHEWALARALKGDYASQDIVEIETFDVPPQYRTITLSAGPVHDAKGDIVGGVVAQTDITHQTLAESALRESEAKFRTITNAMPQMIWSTLRDGSRDYFNRQWYEFTGLPVDSLDGEGWNTIIHPDDYGQTYILWKNAVATGESFEHEYRLRHHSGNFRWILARAVPVTDDSGAIVRWMGSCTDLHDQKLTQDALRAADRRKDEFLAMLAHELRNPLAPISAAADLLQLANINSSQIKQTSEIIARQVKHMTSLVDDLLDVSRVTRGLIALENIVINAADIVTEAVEQVRPIIESRHHQLTVNLSPDAVFIQGDRKRLIQVLTNVLNNAAKYTPEGGHIELIMDKDTEHVLFHVRDNGIGMTDDTVHQVFELFAQAERSPDRSIGGLGIGLALVKSLVEHHHGEVSAHSKGLNKGSEFVISLPRVFYKSSIENIGSTSQLSTHTKKLNILIVDDNADAADVLTMLLEFAGYYVMTERHAKGAIERIKLQTPDVCLLDIGLPDMDGNELAQYFRGNPATEKSLLIAITGYGQAEDRKKSKA